MDIERELEKRDTMIRNLIKENKRLRKQRHVYKVEMNRLCRKLERIYYYLGHCEYRKVFSELEQEMVMSWNDMVRLSEEAARRVVEFHKNL